METWVLMLKIKKNEVLLGEELPGGHQGHVGLDDPQEDHLLSCSSKKLKGWIFNHETTVTRAWESTWSPRSPPCRGASGTCKVASVGPAS